MREEEAMVLTLLALMLCVTIVIALPWIIRMLERNKMHQTLRYLVDKGQTPPGEVLAGLIERPKPQPGTHRDLRAGIFWLSLGIGSCALIASIALVGAPETNNWILAPGIAAFPTAIGVGYFVLWFMNRAKTG